MSTCPSNRNNWNGQQSYWLHDACHVEETARAFACLLSAASLSSLRNSSTVNRKPPASSSETTRPMMKIAVSDIALRPRCLTEVVSCREDGWDPQAHEDSGFLAGGHAKAKPKRHREEERQKSCCENQPISSSKHPFASDLAGFVMLFCPALHG